MNGTPRRVKSTDALNWIQRTHHYVQRTNSPTGTLRTNRMLDSQMKKQVTLWRQINKGHMPKPGKAEDRGQSSTNQSTRAVEAKDKGHVGIAEAEQPWETPDRTTPMIEGELQPLNDTNGGGFVESLDPVYQSVNLYHRVQCEFRKRRKIIVVQHDNQTC
ncbi:hypothetical protein CLF_113069 [Clonorchis sinensis]|uniref:Uncharacterized protein n=1 Tax=Clonorchis sinensis TaxID=79923 RepID=G7YXK0_CLOSI|nr:hypothetical protein CLF_113069 [Clonorchis sinensis]